MTGNDADFEKYEEFSEALQRDLIAIHGAKKAERLFKKMDRAEFSAFCEAASRDPLKRKWLERIRTGYANALSRFKNAA